MVVEAQELNLEPKITDCDTKDDEKTCEVSKVKSCMVSVITYNSL